MKEIQILKSRPISTLTVDKHPITCNQNKLVIIRANLWLKIWS